MLTFIILAAVLLALAAPLCCRVHLSASFETDFCVFVRFLFLRLRLRLPSGGKNKGKRNKRSGTAKNRVQLFLRHFGDFFTFVKKTLEALLRHLRVDRFDLRLVVAADDAAQTAIQYGEACAVIFPAAAFLQTLRHTDKQHVSVTPGFQEPESSVRFACDISIRLGALLGIALVRAAALLIALIKKPGAVKPAMPHQKGSAAI